tara:strand:+ start:148 stop:273 length:126 start_codon:yes stop_codon:yes gene_type:complete
MAKKNQDTKTFDLFDQVDARSQVGERQTDLENLIAEAKESK